ncbi:MAG TPA: DNA mismatch repair protein MutS, partial [Aestuariivirga sp.]|nr:DNA mismatch repair protein MutS [Aestuariivirga sp.]
FDAALDENRALRDDTRQVIAALQARYAGETGLRTLRIKHNNILGYFIEVAPQHAALLQTPEHAARFIHRQSIASAIRFTTTELADLEQKIAMAQARALAIEHELFQRFVAAVVAERDSLSALGLALAELDVLAGLATLARERRYVRPVVDHSTRFDIRAGRHPVVEAVLEREGAARFTANDCTLDGADKRLWLVTGPNMAGKSTFLRQNALIALMAQMGSFVPAEAAHIGLVDRLFSRVGAADDLARGRSTFMVEMVETATILNLATDRSLVILDEIGRGTATYDGLSIAWAAVEHLHEVNRARALFATHYHELTALAERLSHLANVTVKVREWQGEVIFLHEVTPGVADRSYGIQVAKLAGLPPAVIARAAQVLDQLEAARDASGQRAAIDALPLFSAQAPPAPRTDALRARLAGLAADELTPRAALALVYELVAALKEEGA